MCAALANRLRLPGSRRLKTGRDFQRARVQGRRLAQGCLILNWFSLPAGRASRVGVVTSRKLGGATVRARARRLLREAFRVHQFELRQPMDVVLVARGSIVGKKFVDAERDLVDALRRAGVLRTANRAGSDISEPPSASSA